MRPAAALRSRATGPIRAALSRAQVRSTLSMRARVRKHKRSHWIHSIRNAELREYQRQAVQLCRRQHAKHYHAVHRHWRAALPLRPQSRMPGQLAFINLSGSSSQTMNELAISYLAATGVRLAPLLTNRNLSPTAVAIGWFAEAPPLIVPTTHGGSLLAMSLALFLFGIAALLINIHRCRPCWAGSVFHDDLRSRSQNQGTTRRQGRC